MPHPPALDASPPPAVDPPRTVRMRGTPAGGGVCFGVARVLTRVGAHESLRPGEVLVVPAITPQLAALLPFAGAVVAERGATLSGGLMLARELHVPAVVALPDATAAIATGDDVLVDGTSGAVTVHPRRR